MRESEYGSPYAILTVDAEETSTMNGEPIRGEYAWHAFHTMARNEVAKKRPQVGERIGACYHGKGQAAPGMNPPERWRLIVDRPPAEQRAIDWPTVSDDAPKLEQLTDEHGVEGDKSREQRPRLVVDDPDDDIPF
jgi:hypothetical protein